MITYLELLCEREEPKSQGHPTALVMATGGNELSLIKTRKAIRMMKTKSLVWAC